MTQIIQNPFCFLKSFPNLKPKKQLLIICLHQIVTLIRDDLYFKLTLN